MSDPAFRFVTAPQALLGAPAGWAAEMLRDGEVALLTSDGLDAINQLAHELGSAAIQVVRSEADGASQDKTVISYAAALPTIWVAPQFSEQAEGWATKRGPMTLLVQSAESIASSRCSAVNRSNQLRRIADNWGV
jgi:hypothetical protein